LEKRFEQLKEQALKYKNNAREQRKNKEVQDAFEAMELAEKQKGEEEKKMTQL
jgi:hypothetical protein